MSDAFQSYVTVSDNGDIEVRVSSVAEAKLAIKELRLRKKAVAASKREVQLQINGISAERRDVLASQGRMVRGGGTFGKLMRTFEGASRDQARAAHEQRLQPFQNQKAALDAQALNIDQLIVQLEAYILQND